MLRANRLDASQPGDRIFEAEIVHLIINSKTEKALELLSQHYRISPPELKVGMPKGNIKHKACYVAKNKTIHIASSDGLNNPYIILHEFYHHLRTSGATHRGTEKNADEFARDYIASFRYVSDAQS
jgi:hypothetical protein